MSTAKYFDRLCAAVLALCLAVTVLLYHADALGLRAMERELGYESMLFAAGTVHKVDIVMDDWEGFLQTAQSEEYTLCDVVIDGEAVRSVGIRGKGNTSLSQVAAMDSQRYSFKLEFDHYDNGKSYHGLDKLCLNNLIQDNTMMKDYLVYQLMGQFGAAAPLCSFVFVTVNGQDWGLYLAVEGIEDGFLRRTYGTGHGALYKPDSLSMGGGRGNGRDFDMEELKKEGSDGAAGQAAPVWPSDGKRQHGDGRGFGGGIPEGAEPPGDAASNGGFGVFPPGDFDGGMGSSDVKLQYLDDDPDSYANIFDNAKTDVSAADQQRLIRSLKALSQGDSSAVDAEAVLRYFTVHNFVVNGDSYTGSMVHNYYLYEQDGLLSMLPWDYNLAFGTFHGSSAASAVNDDIAAPLSCTGNGDRPMMDWILNDPEALAQYHQYLADFLEQFDLSAMIRETAALIAPYVEQDPTRFCTVEEFESGVTALEQFCALRSESVRRQLAGDDTPVDTGSLNLSHMGTMSVGGGMPQMPQGAEPGQPDGTDMPQPPDSAGRDGFPGDTSGKRPADEDAFSASPSGNDSTASGSVDGSLSVESSDPFPFAPGGADGSASGSRGFPVENNGADGSALGGRSFPSEPGSAEGLAPSLLLTAASILVLLAGLVIARRFRR